MSSAIALDANLLVLLVVGEVDGNRVEKHRRLSGYTYWDYWLLREFVGDAPLRVTPNVMTEASNLVVYGVKEPLRTSYLHSLGTLADNATEQYAPSANVKDEREYERLGLADTAWLSLLSSGERLATVDLGLYLSALSRGIEATNFNHLRDGVTI